MDTWEFFMKMAGLSPDEKSAVSRQHLSGVVPGTGTGGRDMFDDAPLTQAMSKLKEQEAKNSGKK